MITQFALRLICGMSLMWSAMPRREVTSGFFRIQMLVVMGLSVLAALTGKVEDASAWGISSRLAFAIPAAVMGVLAYCGSIIWTLGRRKSGAAVVFAIAALSTAMVVYLALQIRPPGESAPAVQPALTAFAELTSSLLLGGAVTGMLLGHWYLTAPTMSIAPLSRLNAFFGAASVARLITSAVALSVGWNQISGSTHLTWLLLRWCAGIAGPLVVSVMTWRILKYRNTQSATGVLFVGVIVVFIGEMTAVLLLGETGIPF
ncbi:MAG: hypothetical protein AB7O26_17590 [Planctomycetaceae bacterium]